MDNNTKIILLLCLIGALITFLVYNKQSIEKFTNPAKPVNPDDIVIGSLEWVRPIVKQCTDKKGTATLINVELSKVMEKSTVKCFTKGKFNLEAQFQKPNTKTIMTAKNDVVAELYSEKDGKGRLLGLIPNPSGTTFNYSRDNMNAKSIVVKNRADYTLDELDKLEYVLPPRRWFCTKTGKTWSPVLRTEVFGNVEEDKRPVKCDKDGHPYFTDDKAKFKINQVLATKPQP